MEEFKYLIPEESMDTMMNQVSSLREIEGHLRHVFNEHGYLEVLTPSFEYVDLYNDMDIGIEEEKLFQYINHEGKHIALRADFTVPLARLYSTKHEKGIQRYSYFGSVYRREKKHKGRNNEFFQAGIELLGNPGELGDHECLNIIQETLSCLKLKDVKIEMSSAKFYKRLCDLVEDDSFVEILKMRSISAMEELIQRKQIQSPLKDLLIALPGCFGTIDMLNQMIDIISDQELKDALIELRTLYHQLDQKEYFSFDLAMTPSMTYYTGLMIKGYCLSCAETIINGGRYDKLMNHFHQDVPAIGFSYNLTQILKALEKEEDCCD
ncbi:MAG: ATP phosphoribosyltransferase regulatory subunit [Coprobacillus sp.]